MTRASRIAGTITATVLAGAVILAVGLGGPAALGWLVLGLALGLVAGFIFTEIAEGWPLDFLDDDND